MSKNKPINVFISYARKDKIYKDEFLKHLVSLKREGLIESWDDGQLAPGVEWDTEIKSRIDDSQMVVFLLSQDAVASEYMYNVEIKKSIENGKIILPVLLKPCDWMSLPISRFQVFPRDGKALSTFSDSDRDSALVEMISELRKRLKNIDKEKARHKKKLLDSKKLLPHIYQLSSILEQVVDLMNNIPMVTEKEGLRLAMFLDKEKFQKEILEKTFLFISIRNIILEELRYGEEKLQEEIEEILSTIFTYVTMSRIGHDIAEKTWRDVFEREIQIHLYTLILKLDLPLKYT